MCRRKVWASSRWTTTKATDRCALCGRHRTERRVHLRLALAFYAPLTRVAHTCVMQGHWERWTFINLFKQTRDFCPNAVYFLTRILNPVRENKACHSLPIVCSEISCTEHGLCTSIAFRNPQSDDSCTRHGSLSLSPVVW